MVSRHLFFHVQIILYGFDPLDASGDITCSIDGHLGINEAAQLNDAFVSSEILTLAIDFM
jgi:hypothetical protein